jgi:hypothetical protein
MIIFKEKQEYKKKNEIKLPANPTILVCVAGTSEDCISEVVSLIIGSI